MRTIEEAASICGVPVAQLVRWAYQKSGPRLLSGHPFNPKSMRYDPSDLEAWKAQRKPWKVS